MEGIIEFFKKEFPKGCSIMTPQFERTEKLEYDWKPQDLYEFNTIIEKAPFSILKGFGFRKWAKMNECIAENAESSSEKTIEIPIINSDDNLKMDIGCGDAPTVQLKIDEDIILFPGEWYDIIPDGFIVTGLYGESYKFEKDKSDDDIRFGCLPYGIRRKIE